MRSLSQVQSEQAPAVIAEPMRAASQLDETLSPSPRGPRILLLAALASIAWSALATAAILLLARYRPESLGLADFAALAAGVAAPLAAISQIALTVARVAPGQARASLARIEQAEANQRPELAAQRRRDVGLGDEVGVERLLQRRPQVAGAFRRGGRLRRRRLHVALADDAFLLLLGRVGEQRRLRRVVGRVAEAAVSGGQSLEIE